MSYIMGELISILGEKKIESLVLVILLALSYLSWDTREIVMELQTRQAVVAVKLTSNGRAIDDLKRDRSADRTVRDRELDSIQADIRDLQRGR